MASESAIRLIFFIFMLIVMGGAETLWPKRTLDISKIHRWFSNISISFISTILVRFSIPIIPTGLALYCQQNNLGLINLISIPDWVAIPLCVLLLDMVIYWQHVLFHKQRLLWLIHRMHHADTNIDASTGIRFHPIEIMISILIKLAVILILGPPVTAVIIFEILLNGCALFNHANVRIPIAVDSILRLLVVTPDMHRVHHSIDIRETNMNYGFNFPWWDKLFGTYKAQPDMGHNDMTIGLKLFRDATFVRLYKMLTIPFL
jgi:sterol desaturase/sphingolipid hydroxylase (fatty acid hydroxylase superfamily)